jgi:hypothetical protein
MGRFWVAAAIVMSEYRQAGARWIDVRGSQTTPGSSWIASTLFALGRTSVPRSQQSWFVISFSPDCATQHHLVNRGCSYCCWSGHGNPERPVAFQAFKRTKSVDAPLSNQPMVWRGATNWTIAAAKTSYPPPEQHWSCSHLIGKCEFCCWASDVSSKPRDLVLDAGMQRQQWSCERCGSRGHRETVADGCDGDLDGPSEITMDAHRPSPVPAQLP